MRNASLVALLVVTAVLYFARDVLIPLALAILLSFLLAPAVRRLEQWKLGRVVSTLVVVVLGFSLIGAVGWVAGRQAISLTAKLPEYRANVQEKMRVLRDPSSGTELGKAAEAIRDLERHADPAPHKPMPVTETPRSPFAQLIEMVAPIAKPVGTALALGRMLPAPDFNARVIPFPLLAAETLDRIAEHDCKIVCISALPPAAATHAAHLCKRLKHRFPDLKVLVALWTSESTARAAARLRAAGVDVVVTNLPDAIDQLHQLTVPLSLELQHQNQGRTTISRTASSGSEPGFRKRSR